MEGVFSAGARLIPWENRILRFRLRVGGEDGPVQGGRQVAQLPPHPSTDGDVNRGNGALEDVESEGIAGVQRVLLVGAVVWVAQEPG